MRNNNPTLYIVGDSTVSSFKDPYYYPRYGYGTQLENYFQSQLSIVNLAMSGRSSRSYITEKNYEILKKSIKSGDFLMIGFGHNDEKYEDKIRFTSALKPIEDKESFLYYLNEFYINLAIEKGATPILCTPIVRLNEKEDYTGEYAHKTKTGDYAEAILKLGNLKGITVLDLCKMTMQEYQRIGYQEARLYHAILLGKFSEDNQSIIPNFSTVDIAHLNIFGAKFVAYLVAKLLNESVSPLKNYLRDSIRKPIKEESLVSNPNYVYKEYIVPDLTAYQPKSHLSTISKGWYGTAFGDCGGNPQELETGFIAKEIEPSIYTVGQHGNSINGKLTLSADGLAFIFQQIDVKYNFEITAKARVLNCVNIKQAGFGLMLRDDCYLNQQNSAELISSNYLAAGFITGEDNMQVLFRRENSNLFAEENILPIYQEDESAVFKIIRIGQSATIYVLYKGQTFTKTFYDFDFLAIDQKYMYVGMFATKGTLAEFTSVDFKITGKTQGA